MEKIVMIDQIGIDAGKVWNELELNGEMTTGALKKSLGMAPFDLNIAIGWLAREDKISLTRKGNTIKVKLQ
ncbi:MAG: winged helix-turn-helix domain-containing protein [Deltaproteobacteria bacterium]|nr:winged helix-turn-helix domain-containing protein [Candidatus Tharpella sp.]